MAGWNNVTTYARRLVRGAYGALSHEDGRPGSEAVPTISTLLKSYRSEIPTAQWGCSSAGRAPRSQRGGHRFDPGQLHHTPDSILEIGLLLRGDLVQRREKRWRRSRWCYVGSRN